MQQMYNEAYYKNYRTENGTVSYRDSQPLEDFLDGVAGWIAETFRPKTVLDAGCALGVLVAALRRRGIEAYGVDISEYAVAHAPEEAKPYLAVGDLKDPLPKTLPQSYDLVLCMEVLEHLDEQNGKKAIANLSGYTEQILFCSTPTDDGDPTHINVQPELFWRDQFAHNSFYAEEIPPNAPWPSYGFYFKKQHAGAVSVALLHQTEAQQNQIAQLLAEQQSEKRKLQNAKQKIQFLEDVMRRTAQEKEAKNKQYENLYRQYDAVQTQYRTIADSTIWRMSKPLRALLDALKKALRRITPLVLVFKGIKSLLRVGPSATWQKMKTRRANKKAAGFNPYGDYTEQDYEAQRNTKFPKDITFSILVPLYNTSEQFLRELIESVQAQTYPKWQLCLADGSDKPGNIEQLVRSYAEKDPRILYHKIGENRGISGNTNAAAEMATGEYCALLDHDDLLHPAALYENMKAICEQGADFIYTDELTYQGKLQNIVIRHYKPDFSIENLRANNYICHFSVFDTELFHQVGLFRSECDGSQDYDMVLRLTEKAKKIVHIPKVLYFWRSHESSVAFSLTTKPYVFEAAKWAISDHLKRMGLKGEVQDGKMLSTYRVRYEIEGTPLVSILIPTKDHVEDLDNCLRSIFEKTTYPNYEIVLVENGSELPETFSYYQTLSEYEKIKLVHWKDSFNYAKINNYGAEFCDGEYLLLLNNDTEVITPNWIEEMLMFAQRKDVGAVGAKLYYRNDTIQHGGVLLGVGAHGIAGHFYSGAPKEDPGYMCRLTYAQNLSAVTGACMLIRKSVWQELGGLDADFAVAFNDVDLCLRMREKGYLIVFTPHAELYHYESKSRGMETEAENAERFSHEVALFRKRWGKTIDQGDPYYNPNFDPDSNCFAMRSV